METIHTDYQLLAAQAKELMDDQPHWVTALANVAALLAQTLENINWAGFYLVGSSLDRDLSSDELVLGPYVGKVACTRIPFGRGVCGTAALLDQTQRVEDVHTFADHIACDADSASEIVVPLRANGKVIGVLDIDSPSKSRFSEVDQQGLEQVALCVQTHLRLGNKCQPRS